MAVSAVTAVAAMAAAVSAAAAAAAASMSAASRSARAATALSTALISPGPGLAPGRGTVLAGLGSATLAALAAIRRLLALVVLGALRGLLTFLGIRTHMVVLARVAAELGATRSGPENSPERILRVSAGRTSQQATDGDGAGNDDGERGEPNVMPKHENSPFGMGDNLLY